MELNYQLQKALKIKTKGKMEVIAGIIVSVSGAVIYAATSTGDSESSGNMGIAFMAAGLGAVLWGGIDYYDGNNRYKYIENE